MSCLHSHLIDLLKERNLVPEVVDVFLIGLSDEVVAQYRFTFDEFKDRDEIYIYSWFVRENTLIVHATIDPVIDIKDHMVWSNETQLREYNDVRQRILQRRIESLKQEFIEL